MPKKMVTIYADPEVWEKYKTLCRKNGATPSSRLRFLMQSEINLAEAQGQNLLKPHEQNWNK